MNTLEHATEQLLKSWDNSTNDFVEKINLLRIALAKQRYENIHSPVLCTPAQRVSTTGSPSQNTNRSVSSNTE
jgi:hypothetical protein